LTKETGKLEATMNLYEVIFWGAAGREGGDDTIYLVRAPDFHTAVKEVSNNASANHHGGQRFPIAHRVHELGKDSSTLEEARILRGPYFQPAYNWGWPAWNRKIVGSGYTSDWEREYCGM
jgi:hypothetical protein